MSTRCDKARSIVDICLLSNLQSLSSWADSPCSTLTYVSTWSDKSRSIVNICLSSIQQLLPGWAGGPHITLTLISTRSDKARLIAGVCLLVHAQHADVNVYGLTKRVRNIVQSSAMADGNKLCATQSTISQLWHQSHSHDVYLLVVDSRHIGTTTNTGNMGMTTTKVSSDQIDNNKSRCDLNVLIE